MKTKGIESLSPKYDKEGSIVEIIEYIIPIISATCNLASLSLSRFIREKGVPIESHPSNIFGSLGLRTATLVLTSYERSHQYLLKT